MAKKHIHKYQHVSTKFQRVWKCGDPFCSHIMGPHLEAVIPGRASICWNCGNQFVLTPELMERDRPICTSCQILETTGVNIADMEKILEEFEKEK